ncbi:MAG: hypothetical protein KKE20_01420, partial [Nanoarchaeota archaeon]|nr:hypothetical protein [Nanoarchaeota archaeon]
MTLDFITRSEFVNLKLRRFKDDITYNETFSPYKGLFKLKVQNTNLFHTPLVLGLFIPPLGALIGIAYGIHGMATENLRRPKTTVVDNAVSTYGDRIYNTPYKGTASGVVRALEKFDTAEYFVKRKILRCMKKGRYKEAMSRFYMLNREQHISSREDRLVFGAMLMQAGKYDDAMNVFKGQVLNYEDLPDNPSVMTLSELSKIIDLDSRAKKAIDFFSQDFSLKNRSDIDQQTFMDTLDSLFTNSDSLDSRIYNGIISHELFRDSSTQKWNSIIRDIIASRQECTPGSANVIIYKGDSFKEQLVIKFGDADSFVKDAARTRRLEGIIKEYNDNIKHAPTFLVMPGVIRYNALKTHKPIGIFEVDGRTSYVSLMAPGTSFLTVGETVRSNFIDIYPLLMDSISFIHNHLSEDDAESEVN